MTWFSRPVLVLSGVVLAILPCVQAQGPAETQPTRPEVVISEIQLHDAPIDELFDLLRSADPKLKLLVVREWNAPVGEPVIADLSVRQVTVSQLLEALSETYPELRISRAGDAADGPIWTVRIRRLQPMLILPQARTRVFRLREAIDQLQADFGFESRSAARDALLILIETALKVSDDENLPVLQVHQATETLVFRGMPEQEALVDDALRAANPATKGQGKTYATTQQARTPDVAGGANSEPARPAPREQVTEPPPAR
jgi:hypothetical protein